MYVVGKKLSSNSMKTWMLKDVLRERKFFNVFIGGNYLAFSTKKIFLKKTLKDFPLKKVKEFPVKKCDTALTVDF